MKALPTLHPGIEELIRGALHDIGVDALVGGGSSNRITTFVAAGARDSTMTWHAGILARAVTRGERTLLEALGEMEHWVDNFVEKVVGDPLTTEKAQKKLVEFLVRDVTGERRMALPLGWDEGLTDEDKEKLGLAFTADDEKWPATRILEYVAYEFARFDDPNSEGRIAAINVALDRVARAGLEISPLDEGRIIRFISAQQQGTVTIADLKRQLVQLRKGDIAGENHDEIAVAVLKHLEQFGEIRHEAGSFWQWKGAYWDKMDQQGIMKVISNEFGFYPACKRYSDYVGVFKSMSSVAEKELVRVNVKGLNFANGFLTEDLQLLEHNPDHGMTYVLPYRSLPEEEGHMPMFSQYLVDSWGEDPDFADKVAALQEAMGVTLFGMATRHQRAFLLYGQAGSGKSVLMSIMRGLLPRNSVSSISPHDWTDKFMPADLFGKVLNCAGELSETKPIPGDIFKQVIVGDAIQAQHKNQNPFDFHPQCAHWFSSNHLPKTRDTSAGFNRRWLILEWSRKVPEAKKVLDLDQVILENEREAIVAWAVQGMARVRKNREYTLPTSHQGYVCRMSADNDSVRYYRAASPRLQIVDRRKWAEVKTIDVWEINRDYSSFCISRNRNRPVFLIVFISRMRDLANEIGFGVLEDETGLLTGFAGIVICSHPS